MLNTVLIYQLIILKYSFNPLIIWWVFSVWMFAAALSVLVFLVSRDVMCPIKLECLNVTPSSS